MMNDVPVLDKEMSTTGKNLSDSIVEKYAFVFQSCDVDMKLLVENKVSHYPASDVLLKKARFLYRNQEIGWIEALAAFQEKHGDCLALDGKDAAKALEKAFDLCRWMGEESDYLQTVYQRRADEKRTELFDRMDRLSLKLKVCHCLSEGKTNEYLKAVLRKLEQSGNIWHVHDEILKIYYLLSYDLTGFSQNLPVLIDIVCRLITNGLMTEEECDDFSGVLKRKAKEMDDKVSEYWFSDDWDTLHPLITESVRLHTFVFLICGQCRQKEDDLSLIAARICRYLSRIPSPYSELLKNKSYTLLTGENTLGDRIQWEHLQHFDEIKILERLIMIQADDKACLFQEDSKKWRQCRNEKNMITLDNDGFTLSPLVELECNSWKGRKDRATVLKNRLFVASFSRLSLNFDACKNIRDFRSYWNLVAEDYPLSQPMSSPAFVDTGSDEKEIEIPEIEMEEEEVETDHFLRPDQRVKVRILHIDKEDMSLKMEIIDAPYRGMKACLPFAYINSCYYIIPGFMDMFAVNEIFRAKVKSVEGSEVKLSLIQDFNEYMYPDCVRKKNVIGKVIDIAEGKVWWLLSTGMTATTTNPHKKYKAGNFYKVEYGGLSADKLKNTIKVLSHIPFPDEKGFYNNVLENLRSFFFFMTKEVLKVNKGKEELQRLKEKNNPFFVAFQSLNLEVPESALDESAQTDEMPESESKTVTPDLYDESDRITVSQLKELIYCVDSLIGDSEDICGCFNAYNVLIFLCRFVGNKELADYYGLCSDYIYWVNSLDSELLKNRERVECRQTFKGLSDRMEALDMDRYSLRLRNNKQVIRVLQTWFDSRPLTSVQSDLQSFMQNKNRTVAELARYFNIMSYLKEKDDDLQELICENINVLLGCKVWEKKPRVYIPVFFGHEGVEKEFKTSAFIHADKNATEEQSLVLARVIASFMNTEGGTLYIGVNDKGYLTGLDQELRFAHNDSDVYLRSVNQNVIRLLGKKEDRDRYQAYIRCRLYEYEDGRLVLAFRVAPINEVVEVKGEVYTRSASSNLIKPVGNVADFVKLRHRQKLDSVPKMPEFPAYFSAERNEYIFDKRSVVLEMTAVQEVEAVAPVLSVNEENVQEKALRTKNANTQINLGIRTSALRCNPLQKKHDLGYTPNHVFVSLFKNGKIAYSVSPKIGKWGGEGGSVIFSYNPEDKEDLLVTVFKNGEVGLSNLKKGMSQPNMLFAFAGSIDDILFISPARSTDYLLLISDKEGEKRYRIVPLDMLEKSMSIQPKSNLVLVPEKGIFVFAEILIPELVNSLDDEKSLQDTFDQYCAGRLWEHNSYIKNVDKISNLCNVPF
ncbi:MULTISPECIES: AlbA family DNA-binding domain-containing protein [Parabacteroides]|uniref:AlbA family DNA-binding domain-containing protein n=1 Tax=Parabacteroides TaxID=375288 RepID=UPI001E3BA6B6|nr:ATP-binding protein [Parabacteroides merdae]